MVLIGFVSLLIVFYSALVMGSYRKLAQNNIFLKGKAKLFFPIVPLGIIVLHLIWSLRALKDNPKTSMKILQLALFKYPVVLGLLIELILERVAIRLSRNEKIIRLQKSKSLKEAVRKSNALDFKNMNTNQSKKIFKEYQHTILSYSAS